MKTKLKKKYTCFLCGLSRIGNADSKKDIICWVCVQRLLNTAELNPSKIKTLYDKFIKKGWLEKAELIENWLPEEEVKYHEEPRRTVVGRGTYKQTTFAKQKREIRKNRQLDTQRA